MPIRKPNKSYKELRAAISGDSGMLDVADTEPVSDRASKSIPPQLKSESLYPKTANVTPASGAPDQPAPKPTPDKRIQRAKPVVAQAEDSMVIRVTMRPPKRGLSKEYDDITDFANEATALKTILTRALAFVSNPDDMVLNRTKPFYESVAGEPFRSRRVIKIAILEAIRAEYDPLDILTDHAFGQTVTDVIVNSYFARNTSTK